MNEITYGRFDKVLRSLGFMLRKSEPVHACIGTITPVHWLFCRTEPTVTSYLSDT